MHWPTSLASATAIHPSSFNLAEDQSFGNDDTQRTLAAAGLPVPPVRSYLDAVLDHYLLQRKQRSRS